MSNGLSDGQQSILAAVSILLAPLGGLSIPAGAPWYVGLCISAFGALGFAVKEVLGTKDGQQKQQQQQPQTIVIHQAPQQQVAHQPTVYDVNPKWNPDEIAALETNFTPQELAQIKGASDPEHIAWDEIPPNVVPAAVKLWGFYHGMLPVAATPSAPQSTPRAG